jgi:hypothetical protein
MSLNGNQRSRIADWLNQRKIKCPLCGGQDMGIHDGVYGLPTLRQKGGPLHLIEGLEQVVCQCQGCGYLMAFAVKALGLT